MHQAAVKFTNTGRPSAVSSRTRCSDHGRWSSTPAARPETSSTAIGAAQRVALALDRSGWPEMVGNIGGDDTVFVACDTATNQKILIAKIERARS